MGLRFAAVGMLVLAGSVWTVWPSTEPTDEPVAVARLRDARVPAIVQQVRAVAVDLELDPELEESEPSEQPTLDEDGLTDDERWESRVAELEDRLESSRRGALHGVVQDAANAERLAGVTVIASSPDVEGVYTAITDEHGYYAIAELLPGDYVVSFYYLDTSRSELAKITSRAVTPMMQALPHDIPWNRPFVLTLGEPVDVSLDNLPSTVSFSGIESTQNTYVADGIDTTGLTFGDDE